MGWGPERRPVKVDLDVVTRDKSRRTALRIWFQRKYQNDGRDYNVGDLMADIPYKTAGLRNPMPKDEKEAWRYHCQNDLSSQNQAKLKKAIVDAILTERQIVYTYRPKTSPGWNVVVDAKTKPAVRITVTGPGFRGGPGHEPG